MAALWRGQWVLTVCRHTRLKLGPREGRGDQDWLILIEPIAAVGRYLQRLVARYSSPFWLLVHPY